MHWEVWRIWLSGLASLEELETKWDLCEILTANEALDMKEEMEHEAWLQSKNS